ncbi:MAG: glycine zipper domain-containing protein [Rhodospirillaceae bacterium]
MRKVLLPLSLIGALSLGACENLTDQQKRVGVGAAGGAALGAVTTGSATGTLTGGALGAGAGYLYDRYEEGRL